MSLCQSLCGNGVVNPGDCYDVEIDTQVIDPGWDYYRFTFKASEYVPSGTTLFITLEFADWTDPSTGEVVTAWNTDVPIGTEVHVN